MKNIRKAKTFSEIFSSLILVVFYGVIGGLYGLCCFSFVLNVPCVVKVLGYSIFTSVASGIVGGLLCSFSAIYTIKLISKIWPAKKKTKEQPKQGD